MTDTQTAAAPIILTPIGPGPDYKRTTVWLPQLFLETSRAGGALLIENRTFTECLIEGPAVLLALEGCQFDGCNMGVAGNPRNLLLKPLGEAGIDEYLARVPRDQPGSTLP